MQEEKTGVLYMQKAGEDENGGGEGDGREIGRRNGSRNRDEERGNKKRVRELGGEEEANKGEEAGAE